MGLTLVLAAIHGVSTQTANTLQVCGFAGVIYNGHVKQQPGKK